MHPLATHSFTVDRITRRRVLSGVALALGGLAAGLDSGQPLSNKP